MKVVTSYNVRLTLFSITNAESVGFMLDANIINGRVLVKFYFKKVEFPPL